MRLNYYEIPFQHSKLFFSFSEYFGNTPFFTVKHLSKIIEGGQGRGERVNRIITVYERIITSANQYICCKKFIETKFDAISSSIVVALSITRNSEK